jgi:hypothetical protein
MKSRPEMYDVIIVFHIPVNVLNINHFETRTRGLLFSPNRYAASLFSDFVFSGHKKLRSGIKMDGRSGNQKQDFFGGL